MERASKSLGKLKLAKSFSSEELVRAAWQSAVGRRLALRTSVLSLVRDRLVIEVEDNIWKQQLWQLRFQILENLWEVVGPETVRDLEFRIANPNAPRRPVSSTDRLQSSAPLDLPLDEASGIRDPLLRKLYQEARRKASA